MKKCLPPLAALFLVGCATQQPLPLITTQPDNNTTYKVDYLFEHGGCKVYRFYDRGNYIYYTNCNGEAIVRTDSTEIRNTIVLQKREKKE